ncbi:MAG: hypothetical protein HY077_02445 [Elusimicrobia bacterium]|nr:hypothetical protein [Elusimicrobiota bacterium]
MRRKRGGVGLFLGLLAMYAAVFAGRGWWAQWVRAVHLEPSAPVYYHDALVEIRLWTRDAAVNQRWRAEPPVVEVKRGGEPVTTIGGLGGVRLSYDSTRDAWTGRWPCPWNAEAGEYTLALFGAETFGPRLAARPFRIAYRRPAALPRGLSVLTLETSTPLRGMVVTGPDGEKKDWRGLLDWVQYVGADAFWMLGGQTPGDKPGETWVSYNLDMIPQVAKECRRRGLKFGVYAMCYLTMSKERLPGYQYALEVKDGKSVFTRAISLNDPNRPSDVAALLKRFSDIPEVDYVGLDYIRNALGGYELADDFFREMPGTVPPAGWDKLSAGEKRVWFARKKVMRRDMAFIDQWQWWRAHRVAAVVRRIKAEVGGNKPLWAFTLTWDRGWHHGQDPVMMNDAGVDADSLMLYEATREQFGALIRDWHDYVKRSDVQLVVGDVMDWPLHQRAPDGPKELGRRMKAAIEGIYGEGPAAGIFFHDLGRALWGRVGPWGTKGWMDEAKSVTRYFHEVSAGAPR